MTKSQRQHVLVRLLGQQAVYSQTQLVDLLAAEGIVATQATVSRDLEDVGAVKVRDSSGDSVYAIPEYPIERVAPPDHLRRVLGEWVVEVTASHNLVVLRTPPGSAPVVGSAVDRASLDGVIGTVAGDDTLFVVAAATTTGDEVAATLRALAGL